MSKDIDLLEKVQHRATRMITGFKNIEYNGRLKLCNITTLETRRWRGDMIQLFKIIKGFDKITMQDLNLKFNRTRRGHNFKLFKKGFRLNVSKFSFSNRVVNTWNKLPMHVVSSSSINMFKNRFDSYCMKKGFL